MLESYHRLMGIHEGKTAFVVGAGTSLNGVDLTPIHDHVVISINSSMLLMPWQSGKPDRRYWISNDALCRAWSYWIKVKTSKATKIVRDSWSKYYKEIPGFLCFSPRKTSEDIIDPEDDGLCYCSSVPTGVDLALKMGCKKVFLLGADHYMDGTKSHFWQYWPVSKQPRRSDRGMASHTQQKEVFAYNDRAYVALLGFAKHCNATIYNCSMKSKIETFEKISFKDAVHTHIASS